MKNKKKKPPKTRKPIAPPSKIHPDKSKYNRRGSKRKTREAIEENLVKNKI